MGYVDAGDSRMTAGSPEKGRKIRFRQPGLIGQGTEGRRLSNLAAWEPAADTEAGALGLAQWPPERLAPWLAALRGPALDQAVRRSLGAWTEGI